MELAVTILAWMGVVWFGGGLVLGAVAFRRMTKREACPKCGS